MLARVLLVPLSLSLLLSGCTVGGGEPTVADDDDPFVIEDPNDFSYLENVSASDRPHIHDYWGGQTVLVLAEGVMTWSGSSTAEVKTHGGQALKIPDGSLVIPGTRWVNITASWQNEHPFAVDFWIEYQTANASIGQVKVPSGQTVSIEVDEEMNDLAHAKRTRWAFRPFATGTGVHWSAKIQANVKVEIAKTDGPLPFAPAHASPWGSNLTKPLLEQAGTLKEPSATTNGTDRPSANLAIQPVPIETGLIRIRLQYNSSTPTQLHYNPVLDYGSADRSTVTGSVKPKRYEPRSVDGIIEWELEVKPEMWDSPYATRSDWQITIYWGGEHGGTKSTTGANYMQGDFRFIVQAERAATA